MLFNLLLANITVLFCFLFSFLVIFTTPVQIENSKLKLALTIPTGALIAVANDAVDIPPLVLDKTIKDLSQ